MRGLVPKKIRGAARASIHVSSAMPLHCGSLEDCIFRVDT